MVFDSPRESLLGLVLGKQVSGTGSDIGTCRPWKPPTSSYVVVSRRSVVGRSLTLTTRRRRELGSGPKAPTSEIDTSES